MRGRLNLAATRLALAGEGTPEQMKALQMRAGETGGAIYGAVDAAKYPVEPGKIPISIEFTSGKFLTWNMSWDEVRAAAKRCRDGFAQAQLGHLSQDSLREQVRMAILDTFGSNEYLKPEIAHECIPMVCWLLTTGEPGRQLSAQAARLKYAGYTVELISPTQFRFRLMAGYDDRAP